MSFLKLSLAGAFVMLAFNAPVMAQAPAQAPAMAAPTVKSMDDAKLGKILTDSKGMTLYMFKSDTANTSTCYDQCAVNWPALLITAGEPVAAPGLVGKLGTTKRRDNKLQVTYNGMPLYYFAKDTKAGDTTGQGVGNNWYVITPAAAK